jgi:hypothetical protein
MSKWSGPCHDNILPVFCPTGQRRRGSECRRDAARKSLIDQRAFYCAWGCLSIFCFERGIDGHVLSAENEPAAAAAVRSLSPFLRGRDELRSR